MKTLVKINTNFGTITVELFEQKAPLTCLNFLSLIEEGYYNRSTFHRVIRSFMMQGGSEDGTGKGGRSKWGGAFNDEYSDLTFSEPYMLAMANSGPNTNTSQFFITVVPTPWLNGKHTIFGKVVDGVKIIDRIMALDSDANGKSVVVRINDRGPAKRLVRQGRVIDLSKGAFLKLSSLKQGVIKVKVEVVK